MEEQYRETCHLFCEDPKTTDPSKFFKLFHDFIMRYKSAARDIDVKLKEEKTLQNAERLKSQNDIVRKNRTARMADPDYTRRHSEVVGHINFNKLRPISDLLTESINFNTNSELIEKLPINGQPMENLPANDQPMENLPANDQPMENLLAKDQPMETLHINDQPMETLHINDQPMETLHINDQSMETLPTNDQPIETLPTNDQSMETRPTNEFTMGDVTSPNTPISVFRNGSAVHLHIPKLPPSLSDNNIGKTQL